VARQENIESIEKTKPRKEGRKRETGNRMIGIGTANTKGNQFGFQRGPALGEEEEEKEKHAKISMERREGGRGRSLSLASGERDRSS